MTNLSGALNAAHDLVSRVTSHLAHQLSVGGKIPQAALDEHQIVLYELACSIAELRAAQETERACAQAAPELNRELEHRAAARHRVSARHEVGAFPRGLMAAGAQLDDVVPPGMAIG